ncbi:Polyketide cyclase / dehydrase and lipid transport [Halogranum rubrum]|uniref:Polyketide cyclase / dehydrase and lipid transport n=1 Tax=Halogranum rubrum TaxID=553466 RepID=A0A1I4F8A4_9EURY|nr:SRPBCC family protein [Halogranum rubrum]SFL13077.1 Polyketide cyclase / dehydrase and lipid transport [Halogranum rubrum]
MNRTDVSLRRTPDGRRLEVSRIVDASAETVWTLFTDPERWPEWGPSVAAVDCEDDRIRRGTTGRVRVVGVWIPFEIDTFDDEVYRWTWRVAKVPATGHRVDPVGENRCRAVFEIPPLAVGYAVVCERALRRIERLATT